ncbi:MAG: HAMP domain-containing protein, partial [Caldilineaceae bacterium]|nr:HAMP domain-containing protein [Caldilineaceae bacterium]
LALAALFVRQITRPVAALGRAAQQIEAGNLAARVDVRSQDELGGLGHAFNRMALALQEQERLRRNLVADVAHELRTPLSGIQGTVEALQDGVFPLDAASLEPIHAQALLLNRLVDDLRTLALADAGELALNMDTVNLTALLTRACEGLRGNAQAGHMELVYTPSAEATPIMVRGDAARLTQVAVNLLDNALQHTPSGGVVTVTTQLVDATVVWRVTDTGSGIAAEDLPHIFERFYRTDRSRSRATGGSGLGLAIVKQIVLAHGGTVAVHSPPPEQARGTQFVVTLPIHT